MSPLRNALSIREWILFLCLAITLAAGSVHLQGFDFGAGNDVFHIPVVLGWGSLPQFGADAFAQSLEKFGTAFWWALKPLANEEGLERLWFWVHFFVRASTFLAVIVVLRVLGLSGYVLVLGACIIASAPLLLNGASVVGGHGLLPRQLSHSLATWPLVLFAFVAAVNSRWAVAAVLVATTFWVNSFVAVWLAVAVGAVALHSRISRRDALQATTVFAFLSAPIIIWTLGSIRAGSTYAANFSFVEYARGYYPNHFLIEAAEGFALLETFSLWVAAIVVSGREGWIRWRVLIVALACVFLIGCVAPYLVDHRITINLHLLRVDGVATFLALLLLVASSLRSIAEGEKRREERSVAFMTLACVAANSFVPLLFALLATISITPHRAARRLALLVMLSGAAVFVGKPGLLWSAGAGLVASYVFVFLLMLHEELRQTRVREFPALIVTGFVLCGALLLARQELGVGLRTLLALPVLFVFAGAFADAPTQSSLESSSGSFAWTQRAAIMGAVCLGVILWAAQFAAATAASPAPDAEVERHWSDLLLSVSRRARRGEIVAAPILVPVSACGLEQRRSIVLSARVPVWVDWRQGAAVMWEPRFHEVWSRRYTEVRALDTDEKVIAYAKANAIPSMVLCKLGNDLPRCPSTHSVIEANESFALCSIAEAG